MVFIALEKERSFYAAPLFLVIYTLLLLWPGTDAASQVVSLKALCSHQVTGRATSVAAAAEHEILLVLIQFAQSGLKLPGGYIEIFGSRYSV